MNETKAHELARIISQLNHMEQNGVEDDLDEYNELVQRHNDLVDLIDLDRVEELKSEADSISQHIKASGKKSPELMDRLQEIRKEIKRLSGK